MFYYFKESPFFAYLKYENVEEMELFEKLPYIYKRKRKTEFFVRFQYLVELSRLLRCKPATKKDLKILTKSFDKSKELDQLSKKLSKPDFDHKVYLDKESWLYPLIAEFQQVGADYLFAARKCILADDVGLGKTIQTIMALCRMVALKVVKQKTLIVTQATIKHQWKNEILEHVDLHLLPYFREIAVVTGKRKERKKVYESSKKILIVNYEQFLHDFGEIFSISKTVDCIVCDEASYIKNPRAKRTMKMKSIMYNVPVKILITATPIENKLLDLYSLCQFLDKSVFVNYKYFEQSYCNFMRFRLGKHGPLIKKLSKQDPYKNIADAKFKIRGFYIRRTVDMVGVQLPEFLPPQLRLVKLCPEQRKLYDKIKRTQFVSTQKQKHLLLEACNVPEHFSDSLIGKSSKIKELISMIEGELSGKKIIVFCFYKRFMNVLYKKLKKYHPLYIHGGTPHKKREKYRQMFNKLDKYKIILLTGAGERGIDLPAASVLINLDLPENPSRLKQRCGRPRRLSSKHKHITIINILAKNTIEEKTIKTVFSKMELFQKFFTEDHPDLVGKASFYDDMSSKEIKKLF